MTEPFTREHQETIARLAREVYILKFTSSIALGLSLAAILGLIFR
jgi:hypothetical protein